MTSRRPIVFAAMGLLARASSWVLHPSTWLVYNPSNSAPRGFYVALPADRLKLGDRVVVALPHAIAEFAADRGYLPRAVPALKQITAMEGNSVCVRVDHVYVDGKTVARTLAVDGKHRVLTSWKGCRLLLKGELFLLNSEAKASFDSRYFGPVDHSFVRARAVPLWTW